VTVGPCVIQPAAAVRDLGVLLDQELSMTQHIAKVTSSCFYQLCRLRQIRRPVRQELVAQMVRSFVLLMLDYGNSVLAGLQKSAITPLQRVQSVAARLILNLRIDDSKRARDTAALKQLHWLPVDHLVGFKLCTMINPHQSVSDVFFRHGVCRRCQPDEVQSAIRQHSSIN